MEYAPCPCFLRKLRLLETSGLNASFDVLNELSDDDLPNLKFLAIRLTQVSEGNLESLRIGMKEVLKI